MKTKKIFIPILFSLGTNILLGGIFGCVWMSLAFHTDIFAFSLFIAMTAGIFLAPLYSELKNRAGAPWLYTLTAAASYILFNCLICLLLLKPQKTLELGYVQCLSFFNGSVLAMMITDILFAVYKTRKSSKKESALRLLSSRGVSALLSAVLTLLMGVAFFISLSYHPSSTEIDFMIYCMHITFLQSLFACLHLRLFQYTTSKLLVCAVACTACVICIPLQYLGCGLIERSSPDMMILLFLPSVVCMLITELICTVCAKLRSKKQMR